MQCLSVHSQQPHAWAAHTGASSHPDALTSGCRVTLVSQEPRKVLRRLHWARPLPLLPLVQWGSGGVGAAHSLHWGSLSPSKSLKLLLSEEKKKKKLLAGPWAAALRLRPPAPRAEEGRGEPGRCLRGACEQAPVLRGGRAPKGCVPLLDFVPALPLPPGGREA